MKRRGSRLGNVGSVIGLALFVVALLIPPLMVEQYGGTTLGTVVGKREEIWTGRQILGWERTLALDVRYTPRGADSPMQAEVVVGEAHYDAARVGDAVEVRYLDRPDLRPLNLFAGVRLEEQGPLGELRARLGSLADLGVALAICAAFLAAWKVTKRQIMLVPVAVIVLAGGLDLWAGSPRPEPAGPWRSAEAEVVETWVRPIERRGSAPFQLFTIASLSFVPAGRTDPVVAVDQVDQGSVPELAPGSRVPIRYSEANPRYARIEGATRTYAWKNPLWVSGVLLLLTAIAVGLWLRGRRRRP